MQSCLNCLCLKYGLPMFCQKTQSLFKRQTRGTEPEIAEADTSNESDSKVEDKCFGLTHSKLVSIGRQSFDFLFQSCEKFWLVPITRLPGGQYVRFNLKNRLVHYFVLTLLLCSGLHKLWGVVHKLSSQDGFEIGSFLCVAAFGIYFASFCISLSVIVKSEDSADLLNRSNHILSCFKKIYINEGSTLLSPFDDVSMALKLISILLLGMGVTFGCSVGSFVHPDLPIRWLPTLELLKILPEGILPPILWQLVLFPLEVITYFCPVVLGCLVGAIGAMSLGVFHIFLKELR